MTPSPARKPTPLPPELSRWNWGAFLLSWIWGLGNRSFATLAIFVPALALIATPVLAPDVPTWRAATAAACLALLAVFGWRGNAWAWRHRHWDDAAQFLAAQRRWAKWGVISWVVIAATVLLLSVAVDALMRTSEVYRHASARALADDRVLRALGEPVSAGTPDGRFDATGGDQTAHFVIPLTGARASGRAVVDARRYSGTWLVTKMTVAVDGTGSAIELPADGE
jgi:hypothetical protein